MYDDGSTTPLLSGTSTYALPTSVGGAYVTTEQLVRLDQLAVRYVIERLESFGNRLSEQHLRYLSHLCTLYTQIASARASGRFVVELSTGL